MRRSEKQITDRAELEAIIRHCPTCRLGLSDDGHPYIVPLSFGFDGTALYFHSAKAGRKMEILERNNRVCVEFDITEGVIPAEAACDWGARYRSVIGLGTAELVEDPSEKRRALDLLMAHYAPGTFTYPDAMVARTAIVKVTFESLSGKQSATLTPTLSPPREREI